MSKPLSKREHKIAKQFVDTLRAAHGDLPLVDVSRDDDTLVVRCVMPRDEAAEEAVRALAWETGGDVMLEHDQPIRLESALYDVTVDFPIEGPDAVRAAWPLYMQLAPFVRDHDGGRVKGLAPGRGGRVELTCRLRSMAFATNDLVRWFAERGITDDLRMQAAGPNGKPTPLYPMNFHQPVSL